MKPQGIEKDFAKAKKIIASCKTAAHVSTASNFVTMFKKHYGVETPMLDEDLARKFFAFSTTGNFCT